MAETPPPPHAEIIRAAEECLDKHGDGSPQGVGWRIPDATSRYRAMLGVVRPGSGAATLLDFGCGLSHLYEYILRNNFTDIQYSGLDLSERFLTLSRQKFPAVPYYDIDVLDPASPPLPLFDYVVINGIFTYMGRIPHDEKKAYMEALVSRVFDIARIGIAFNLMSKQVEWERDDLFHLPIDDLAAFLSRNLSRHFVIRHDYGLYEYTTYVYKQPTAPEQAGAKSRLQDGPSRDVDGADH